MISSDEDYVTLMAIRLGQNFTNINQYGQGHLINLIGMFTDLKCSLPLYL